MDAIQAARAKAAKRWSKLEDQTVPLFDKLANGQAAKSDIEKLKQLYAAQSKSASEAFDKAVKAAKDSAKDSVKETAKDATKKHQLLSTSELRRLLEVAISIALEKSAYFIKKAVELALEDHMDLLDDLIRDVRRMQVKTDEMLFRIKNSTISGMVSKALQEQAETKQGFIRRLVDNDSNKSVTNNAINAMADVVSNKIASTFTDKKGIVEAASKHIDKSSNAANDEASHSDKSGFASRVAGSPNDDAGTSDNRMMSNVARTLIESDEEEDFDQYAARISNSNDSAISELKAQIKDSEKSTALAEDSSDVRRQQASIFERAISAILSSRLLDNRLFSQYDSRFLQLAKDNFARTLKTQKFGSNIKDIKDSLDTLKTTEKNNGKFSDAAYRQYRAAVYRDMKRTWLKQAKSKAAYIQKQLKKYTSKASKYAKWFGIAFLASAIINALNEIAPNWKKSIGDWLSEDGLNLAVETSEKIGELIGAVVVKTLDWIWQHKLEIAQIALGIVSGMTKSIVKAALSLIGLDYDKVFGGKTIFDEAEHRSKITSNEDLFNKFIESKEGKKLQDEIKSSPTHVKYLLGATTLDENTDDYYKKQAVDEAWEKYLKDHPDFAKQVDTVVKGKENSASDKLISSLLENVSSNKKTTGNAAIEADKTVKSAVAKPADTVKQVEKPTADKASFSDTAIQKNAEAAKPYEDKNGTVRVIPVDMASPSYSGPSQVKYDEAKLTNPDYATASLNQPAPFTAGTSDSLSKGLESVRSANTETAKLAQTNTLEPTAVEQPALSKSAIPQQASGSSGKAISTESIQNFPQNDMLILNGGLA